MMNPSSLSPAVSRAALVGLWTVILCVKVIYAYVFHSEYQTQSFEQRGYCTLLNDSSGYYKPLESLVTGKGYGPAARMPGAAPIYVPLRTVFSQNISMSLLVIFQIALDSVAVVAFGLFIRDTYRSATAAWLTIVVLTLSSFVSVWNNSFMMDSLGTSTLLLSVVVFHFGVKRGVVSWKYLLLAGLLATWSVFLRQAHGLLFPIFGLYLLFALRHRERRRQVFIASIALSTVPALIFGIWIGRNYVEHGKFVPFILPFHEGLADGFPKFRTDTYDVVRSLGGDIAPWSGESVWFVDAGHDGSFPFGDRVFTTQFGLREMKQQREKILRAIEMKNHGSRDAELESQIQNQWKEYLIEYRHEHATDYWIWNRLSLLKRLIVQTRLDNLPFPEREQMTTGEFVFKGLQLVLVAVSTLLGTFVGLIIIIRKRPVPLCVLFPLIHLFAMACILRYIEQRYLVPAHPFLVANASFALVWIASLIFRRATPSSAGQEIHIMP